MFERAREPLERDLVTLGMAATVVARVLSVLVNDARLV